MRSIESYLTKAQVIALGLAVDTDPNLRSLKEALEKLQQEELERFDRVTDNKDLNERSLVHIGCRRAGQRDALALLNQARDVAIESQTKKEQ